jgi:malonyl-CoA O-methyltransferase
LFNNTKQPESKDTYLRQDVDYIAWQRFNQIHALSEPFIWQEVQSSLHDRLDMFTVVPQRILNVATRAGTGAIRLAKRYPKAHILSQCITTKAVNHLQRVYKISRLQKIYSWFTRSKSLYTLITWSDTIPKHSQYDLIICNLSLTHTPNPVEQLRLWADLLAPGGVLLFSALGPDTGRNLRLAAQQAGWTTPIGTDFIDMHDYGDMMVQAGLNTPVIDVDRIKLTYPSVQSLRQDCAGLMGNFHSHRLMGLAGKARFQRLKNILNSAIPLVIEFELIFGHAFKPIHLQRTDLLNPDKSVSYVSIDSLKASLSKQRLK